MVKRIKSITFSWLERRRARKLSRDQLRKDMELYLFSIYFAEEKADMELLSSAKKDLAKTERLILCQSFLQLAAIPMSELRME